MSTDVRGAAPRPGEEQRTDVHRRRERRQRLGPYHVTAPRHRDVNGGWLRPAVFGAMDGLVSNFALMTGVAGGRCDVAAPSWSPGLAGLAAGAFSMAAGEYTSVASQRELVEAELDVERLELRRNPEDELRELAALYVSRGCGAGAGRRGRPAAVRATPSRRWRYTPARSWASTRRTCPRRWSPPVSSFVLLRAGRAAAGAAVPAGRARAVARAGAGAGRACSAAARRWPG